MDDLFLVLTWVSPYPKRPLPLPPSINKKIGSYFLQLLCEYNGKICVLTYLLTPYPKLICLQDSNLHLSDMNCPIPLK